MCRKKKEKEILGPYKIIEILARTVLEDVMEEKKNLRRTKSFKS